jgi:uncharacterized protein (DUF362 family)
VTRVAIVSVAEGVEQAFAEAMRLSGCEGLITPGACVLIKPNWNAIGLEGSTSLAVVQAACRWARAQGAGDVIVGEGPVPIPRPDVEAFLGQMNVPEGVEAAGARFVLFDDGEHVLFAGESDLPVETGIARSALEADVIINLPLMKVHSTCLATLCLKNLKGCLRPQDKMAFHRVGLLPAIVALNRLVRPQINVVDAISAMEGDHNRGALVPLGLLIAGRDPVAVDAVSCAQMGIEPSGVPLLRMAAQAGLGECRLSKIQITGETLRPRRFELPQEQLKRAYPDLTIDDAGACTACSAALMDGLFIAGAGRQLSCVALGREAQPAPEALVIGKCLRQYWPTPPHVEGCPPSGHAVAEALCRAVEV